jgi:hypothetical protein
VFETLIESKRQRERKKYVGAGALSLVAHIAIIAGAVIATLSAGQRDSISRSGGGNRISLRGADDGRVVTAASGAEIDITLQTIGFGCYASPKISSRAVRFVSVEGVNPPVDAGPTQRFRFEAVAPGRATIRIPHQGGIVVSRGRLVGENPARTRFGIVVIVASRPALQ